MSRTLADAAGAVLRAAAPADKVALSAEAASLWRDGALAVEGGEASAIIAPHPATPAASQPGANPPGGNAPVNEVPF